MLVDQLSPVMGGVKDKREGVINNFEKANHGSIENKKSFPPLCESKDLFGKEKIIIIRHENNLYRLMITKQGKLILNK